MQHPIEWQAGTPILLHKPLAPTSEGNGIDGREGPVLKVDLSTEILVRSAVRLKAPPYVEHEQTGSQPSWCRMWGAGIAEATLPLQFKRAPVDPISQLY